MLLLAQATEIAPVLVTNPPMGSELQLLAFGFICGAIAWRMFLGRW